MTTFSTFSTKGQSIQETSNHIWLFTYLKALKNQKFELMTYLEKNWFVMDSTVVTQGLLGQYQLIENGDPENTDWDFIVAIEDMTISPHNS